MNCILRNFSNGANCARDLLHSILFYIIAIDQKLFEEIDIPKESKIVSKEDVNGVVERDSKWIGEITGFNSFPNGKITGTGRSLIHSNGISISDWHGIFTTETGQEIIFNGQDTNKNGRYIVLRTYFTNNAEINWLNGLVCILDGYFDFKNNSFICDGYKLM
jgi:hypothetical protein